MPKYNLQNREFLILFEPKADHFNWLCLVHKWENFVEVNAPATDVKSELTNTTTITKQK